MGYILPHLIATTSYFLNDASCQIYNNLNFGFTEFSALIAFPSMSKTAATTIFARAIGLIEQYENKNPNESPIIKPICDSGL